MDGKQPAIDDIREAGRANFSIMPDARIRERVGLSRQTATQSFTKGLKKYAEGRPLKAREREIVQIFGFSMMWQYAFDDQTLSGDLSSLLIADGALAEADQSAFEGVRSFVSLYALSIMHGSKLKLADGEIAQLRLAASDAGLLRIKAEIPFASIPVPTMTNVTLFESSLNAIGHCDPRLLATIAPAIPIEIEDGRLVAIA
jgi:hypothetical protein